MSISVEDAADRAAPLEDDSQLVLVAEDSPNLDTRCFRGSAPLAWLAAISQADIFDQDLNPEGLQRDLSPKHAAEAYDYVRRPADPRLPRAFPEVVLNVRDPEAVHASTRSTGRGRGKLDVVDLTFDLEYIRRQAADGNVVVSRVDGNHRLWYAAGDARRQPVLTVAPYQLHLGLTREQEESLFVDINANQKGLNSSHLAILRSRLTPEELELERNPHRVFARRLALDAQSPWHRLVHMGGSREGAKAAGVTRPVTFISLEQGTRRLLTKSQYVHDLTQADAQYQLIRRYWQAVREVYEQEWDHSREYLVLKNMGVLAFSILGGTVIDRCMARGQVMKDDMSELIRRTRGTWDWSRKADPSGDPPGVSGLSGNRAALIIAGRMSEALEDDASPSIEQRLEGQLASDEP